MVKTLSFKKKHKTYLKTGFKLKPYQKLGIAMLIFVIAFFATGLDELTNLTLKNLNLPTAIDLYRSLGFKYLTF